MDTTALAMSEIRLVGRGGSGVVTAGELLGRAAVAEGRPAQSIPAFGPERRGALCQCTVRLGEGALLLKCGVMRPGVVVLLDPTIWRHVPAMLAVAEKGTLLFNAPAPPAGIDPAGHAVWWVDGTGIGLAELGRPIANTAMLGAFAAATGLVSLDAVREVVAERFPDAAEPNLAAAQAGHDRVARMGG